MNGWIFRSIRSHEPRCTFKFGTREPGYLRCPNVQAISSPSPLWVPTIDQLTNAATSVNPEGGHWTLEKE